MTLSIYIILTILTWGLAQVLIKKGLSYFSPWQSYTIDTFLAVFMWVPYALYQGFDFSRVPSMGLLIMMLLGFNIGLFYYVMNKGPVSIIAPIVAIYPAITLILANIFLHEKLFLFAYGGIIFVILGIIFLSWPDKFAKVKRIWIILALINSLGWGIEGIANKYIIDLTGNGTYILLLLIGQITAVTVWYIKDRPKKIIPKLPGKYLIPTILGVVLWNAGTITYAQAMSVGQTSIITPLTNLYIVVTVIFSKIILKEKIRKIQWMAVIAIVIGLMIIQIPKEIFNNKHLTYNIQQITDNKSIDISLEPTTNNLQLTTEYVIFVYDGDTVQIKNGAHIRLIGINAPEYQWDHQNLECFGKEAHDVLNKLVLNQNVQLETDSEDKDQYGRTLRYIWSDNVLLEELLVRQGYAKVIAIKPNTKYYSLLKSAETEAKLNKRGLWGKCVN